MLRINFEIHRVRWLIVLAVMLCPATAQVRSALAQEGQPQEMAAVGRPAPLTVLDSTRERDGLLGPVRRIRTETAKVSIKAGRLIEQPRTLIEVTTYDLQGNRTANASYPLADNVADVEEEYRYDDKGHLIERLQRAADGEVRSREMYTYEYDLVGNWTKMTSSLAVLAAGKVSHEPVEITYRTITYYFDETISKLVQSATPTPTPTPMPTPLVSLTDSAEAKPKAGVITSSSNKDATQVAEEKPHASLPDVSPTPRDTTSGQESAQAAGVQVAANQVAMGREATDNLDGSPIGNAPTSLTKPLDGGLLNDKALELPEPIYPIGAAFAHVTGRVEVAVLVDETGHVITAHTTSGHPLLSDAAVAAARRARFAPTMFEGRPVKVAGVLSYKFAPAPAAATGTPVSSAISHHAAPSGSLPAEAAAYHKAGLAHYEAGRYKEAVAAFIESTRLNQSSAEVYNDLGLAYSKLKSYDESIAAFKQALRLKPDLAVAYFNLGVVFGEMDQAAAAIKAYKGAIKFDPEDADAHYNLGVLQLKHGDRKAALGEYATLKRLDSALASELEKLMTK